MVALIGGTNTGTLVLGLGTAVAAGSIGAAGWRQARPLRTPGLTSSWWRFALAGPMLIAGLMIAAEAGVEAWFVGIAVANAAVTCTGLGLVLAVAHLARGRAARAST